MILFKIWLACCACVQLHHDLKAIQWNPSITDTIVSQTQVGAFGVEVNGSTVPSGLFGIVCQIYTVDVRY